MRWTPLLVLLLLPAVLRAQEPLAFTDETPERASAPVVARRLQGCAGAEATPTEIAGVEVRGRYTERRPETTPGRTETITAWTLGGLVAWILLHFTGIL
ncbi:MAG: hypothetical protein M3P24_12230 [Gemmatimonadota bacterium]|nr:hypothetical protein [Gemmatimonadota bacterium]